jgi:hypothetical protein
MSLRRILDDNAINAVGENLKSNGISGNTGEAGKEDGKEQFRMIMRGYHKQCGHSAAGRGRGL